MMRCICLLQNNKKQIIRITAGMLALLVIASFALFFLGGAAVKHAEALVADSRLQLFEKDAETASELFSEIKYSLEELAFAISQRADFSDGTYKNGEAVRALMRSVLTERRQSEFSKYAIAAFIADPRSSGSIYELTGVYPSDVFFNQYYLSSKYTAVFWQNGVPEQASFKAYPADTFSTSREAQKVSAVLMPISSSIGSSGCKLVLMLDIEKLSEDVGVSAIYSENEEVLFKNASSPIPAVAEAEGKMENGDYVFRFADEQGTKMSFVRVLTKEIIEEDMGEFAVPVLAVFLAMFALLICVLGYVFMQILRSFKTFEAQEAAVSVVGDSEDFGINQEERDSVLNTVLLQSKMRNVYVDINDIEGKVNISKSYFLVLIRVHYRDEFSKYVGEDTSKATFFLKHLLELYLEKSELASTTFQIENNGIVSLFEVSDDFASNAEIIAKMRACLSNESEYAFFTIAVSKVYNNIESIKSVYDNLLDISKYRKLTAETQELYEGEVGRGAGRFYFSIEEMGKLSAVLQNGSGNEVIHKFREIFDFNIKKEINGFELRLLCSEIVNCSVKLINRMFHSFPQSLDLSGVYRRLELAYTQDEHKIICEEFLYDIADYIRQNKREDDYIISYILDYVDDHYSEDIYLNLFAEKLNLTGAYISSYFKEKMNVNLSDYINNYRIKKAVELSENPQNKNKDIAVMVGLPNINTFIRLFKKYTGYTPGEYRKKHFDYENKK